MDALNFSQEFPVGSISMLDIVTRHSNEKQNGLACATSGVQISQAVYNLYKLIEPKARAVFSFFFIPLPVVFRRRTPY